MDNSFDLIRMEIAVMKKLNHPNLVGLIEVLDDPAQDSLFMVLEMCKKGVVLKIDIEEDVEPYDEDNCRTWFRDLILAIEYLHAHGIVHRDIKPDNCLLTEDNVLKVVDFGVSEMFEKSSEMKLGKKSAGSPAFQAPELCVPRREEILGKPADIWAMGVTLYCLRFGCVPFRQSGLLDLYDAIVNEEVELPDDIEPDFRELMIRLLEKDPAKRITMEELRVRGALSISTSALKLLTYHQEHEWVTRHGEDRLLSFAENCPEVVEPPTELEVNEAITKNMGCVLAVVRRLSHSVYRRVAFLKHLLSRSKRPKSSKHWYTKTDPTWSTASLDKPHALSDHLQPCHRPLFPSLALQPEVRPRRSLKNMLKKPVVRSTPKETECPQDWSPSSTSFRSDYAPR